MKFLPVFAILALTAGCTLQQLKTAQSVNAVVCQQDAALQPVIVPLASAAVAAVAPGTAAGVAGIVALDNAVVHPELQAVCAAVAGVLVGAIAATTPAAAAPVK